MTQKEIRCDLYDIRYYHTHRAMFEKAGLKVVKSMVEEKIKRYVETVKKGGVILHALYSQLYEAGNTQKKAARIPVREVSKIVRRFPLSPRG